MCIAFDGAYILEAPATQQLAKTNECQPGTELTTDDANAEGTERAARLDSVLR